MRSDDPRRSDHVDVIVVGGRCAGSTLATLLARSGLRVVVLEQVRFPKTTLSSNLMEADGITFLSRLGLEDELKKTGVRFMSRLKSRMNDVYVDVPFPLRFDDLGGAVFLRRHVLDEMLADNAQAAGVDLRFGRRMVELIWKDKRVVGVRTEDDSGVRRSVYAPLVVGADGRGSAMANMVGSHKYNVEPNQRSYYFTFFEGAKESGSDAFVFHRWGDRMVWAGPADDGLFLVGVSPEMHERDYFAANRSKGLLAHMRSCEPVHDILADAHIVDRIMGIRTFDGYFRQASGPGWVLVGDAGHFKDPSIGRGISDAFIQVDVLAGVIEKGLGGTHGASLDTRLEAWARWRDRKFAGHYWLACEMGRKGRLPAVISDLVRELDEEGRANEYADLYCHRTEFYDVFPPSRVARASLRVVKQPGDQARLGTLKDTLNLLGREPRHRWINYRPAFASSDIRPVAALRSPKAIQTQSDTGIEFAGEVNEPSKPTAFFRANKIDTGTRSP